jgi:hypothetical protein
MSAKASTAALVVYADKIIRTEADTTIVEESERAAKVGTWKGDGTN